jgi:mannose-6-phosphate isomerase-like protein (cupin superfamily)
MSAILRRADSYRAFEIRPDDGNYFACIVDPVADGGHGIDFTAIVEIYRPGGRTPPNVHARAQELFFVLKGKGRALCDGEMRLIEPGDAIVVQPGTEHVIENIGPGKLYTLTVMVPNEEFAERIHRGTEIALDQDDLNVLRRLPLRR